MSGPEDTFAEQPAIAWLTKDRPGALRWRHTDGTTLAPDGLLGERSSFSEVVLRKTAITALSKLNPDLPPAAIEETITQLSKTDSPQVIEDHQSLHEMLLGGAIVEFTEGGQRVNKIVRLLDFEHPENNDFQVVSQFTIVNGKKNRRPDLLLFVNGLPLGQIELKRPGKDSATAEAAVNQVRHYAETIPALYRFVEIIGVSDLITARVGTITTPPEHFAEWKRLSDQDGDSGQTELQVMLEGVYEPANFLDLIRNFVTFESDGRRTYKVMAKYHQVHAVNAAVATLSGAMKKDGRGGIVWHTQGSGKSYTMVFLVTKLRRDPRFQNPTVVCVTDRVDLDDQLEGNFWRQSHMLNSVMRATEISGGPDSLHDLLDGRKAGGIIFTTIQKFRPPSGTDKMPVLSERSNIIVVADEAHRSQYDGFAANITLALPRASRIGFTGTPIEKADRSSQLVFGDYISVYRMRDAQADGATVPIYYESRQVPVDADAAELAAVAAVLETEETAGADTLISSWAQLEKVVGKDERLVKVADDAAKHFMTRCEEQPGKAIVVAYSRTIAARMTELLRERLGADAVDCVISAGATDPPELSKFRWNKKEMEDLATLFKDPDSALRVVVVRDMWLTGFDAPVMHTLYVDKPMRDHGLLQAIARVNRVFRGKPGGLVVDYIGIGEDLRASLSAYDGGDIEDEPVIPLKLALAGFQEKLEILMDMLYPAGYSGLDGLDPGEGAQLFYDTLNHLLKDEPITKSFLDEQAALAKWNKLVRTEKEASDAKPTVAFMRELAGAIRKYTPPTGVPSAGAEQAVKQFFSTGLAAGDIVDVFGLADKDRPEISVLSDDFLDNIGSQTQHTNLQRKLLEKLLNDEITGRLRTNNTQAKEFSRAMQHILAMYENRQLTSAQVVEKLVELAKRIRDARHRHEQLGLSAEEAAFYDALAGSADDENPDPQLAEIAAEIVTALKRDGLRVDWTEHPSSQAAIRKIIKRILRRKQYEPPTPPVTSGGGGSDTLMDHFARAVYEQAKILYRYWPEVDDGVLFM
ncbi:MAG TPA: type I restriction endonuclease subunit R [Solirubrobacteraceae bacterium]|nr:type I restriction endonuclease subunit R [Solirubrobacteraceae bacterium]